MIKDIILSLMHGFKTKYGNEEWLKRKYKKERMEQLVKVIKNEQINRIR